MSVNQLTGSDVFKARTEIGLSLLSTSKLTGINRNELSKFEQEKGTLPLRNKKALVSFYEDRGYDFNTDLGIDTSSINERYEVSLEDANKEIQSILPTKFSEILTEFVDNQHDIITALLLSNSNQNEQKSFIYGDEKAQELESKLIQHFIDDMAGKVKLSSGVFFSESEENRGMKLVNLLAYLQLKELEQKHPGLVVCSVSKVKSNTDNARILDVMTDSLDVKELNEFADYSSTLIN